MPLSFRGQAMPPTTPTAGQLVFEIVDLEMRSKCLKAWLYKTRCLRAEGGRRCGSSTHLHPGSGAGTLSSAGEMCQNVPQHHRHRGIGELQSLGSLTQMICERNEEHFQELIFNLAASVRAGMCHCSGSPGRL